MAHGQPGCGEPSGSLSNSDASKVLDPVGVRQIVDDFGQFGSHFTRRRVSRGRQLTIVELDGDEVMAHGQPPELDPDGSTLPRNLQRRPLNSCEPAVRFGSANWTSPWERCRRWPSRNVARANWRIIAPPWRLRAEPSLSRGSSSNAPYRNGNGHCNHANNKLMRPEASPDRTGHAIGRSDRTCGRNARRS